MSMTYSDIEPWSTIRYKKADRPLASLTESLMKQPDSYYLKKFNSFPNNIMLWDRKTQDAAIVTYAFAVKSATPPDTGNYVPKNAKTPAGVGNIKEEPGTGAQVSVVFDTSTDAYFHTYLSVVEEWAKSKPLINGASKARGEWMPPSGVATNHRYVITSQIFQAHSPFTASEASKNKIPYAIHPWIRGATVPINDAWIPHPARMVTCEKDSEGMLKEIQKTDRPRLYEGDIVRVSGKLAFTVTSSNFSMALVPLQVIRTVRGAGDMMAIETYARDNTNLDLVKLGEVLKPMTDSDEEIDAAESDERPKGNEKDRENEYLIPEAQHDSEDEPEDKRLPWSPTPPPGRDSSLSGTITESSEGKGDTEKADLKNDKDNGSGPSTITESGDNERTGYKTFNAGASQSEGVGSSGSSLKRKADDEPEKRKRVKTKAK